MAVKIVNVKNSFAYFYRVYGPEDFCLTLRSTQFLRKRSLGLSTYQIPPEKRTMSLQNDMGAFGILKDSMTLPMALEASEIVERTAMSRLLP